MNREIEGLVIDRMNDRDRSDLYTKMIEDRERQIAELKKKIAECRAFDRISREKHKNLKKTSEVIEEIISAGQISDSQLRMLVKKVTVHQNEDATLNIEFEMNGNWNGSYAVMISGGKPGDSLRIEEFPQEFYDAMLKEDMEREREGALLPPSDDLHYEEPPEEYYEAMLREEMERMKIEGQ